jgi:dTDP-4-amino-4,6-dideoxygalactose transaminase
MDCDKLQEYLNKNHKKVACVFPTSLIGFVPEIERLKTICKTFNVPLKFDNCENLMSSYGSYFESKNHVGGFVSNICREFTCSTSGFVAHQISTGTEGGFIFTNSKEEYQYYLLARAHGLIRNLQPYKEHFISNDWNYYYDYEQLYNPLVDYQFDFNVLSSNYRGSDVSAFCGLLDFKRIDKNKKHRIKIYNLFKDNLDKLRYYLPQDRDGYEDVPFCLPIIIRGEHKEERLKRVKDLLDESKIEKRGFVSGNMLRQTVYQKYGNYLDYPNAEILNNFGLYIGLNGKVTESQVLSLVNELNKL